MNEDDSMEAEMNFGQLDLPFINPRKYILASSGTSLTLLTNQLQNIAHSLLDAFCNGNLLTRRYAVLFPSKYTRSKVWTRDLNDLYAILSAIRNRIYGDEELICTEVLVKLKEPLKYKQVNIDDFASIISGSYRILAQLVIRVNNRSTTSEHINTLRTDKEGITRLGGKNPIILELQKEVEDSLGPYLLGFYVHGSVSTLDYTDFSDLDTALIVRKETVEDPQRLKEFAFNNILSSRHLCKYQYLHHHSHCVLAENDLVYYPQSFLPIELFKYSTTLFGISEIEFVLREAHLEQLSIAWQKAQNYKIQFLDRPSRINNLWRLRYLIAILLTLPVFLLNVMGIYVYKGFSFEKARDYFSIQEWEGIDIATEIRENWHYYPSKEERLLARVILDWRKNRRLFEYVMSQRAQTVPNHLEHYIDRMKFYQKALVFTESVARKIYEVGKDEKLP